MDGGWGGVLDFPVKTQFVFSPSSGGSVFCVISFCSEFCEMITFFHVIMNIVSTHFLRNPLVTIFHWKPHFQVPFSSSRDVFLHFSSSQV